MGNILYKVIKYNVSLSRIPDPYEKLWDIMSTYHQSIELRWIMSTYHQSIELRGIMSTYHQSIELRGIMSTLSPIYRINRNNEYISPI